MLQKGQASGAVKKKKKKKRNANGRKPGSEAAPAPAVDRPQAAVSKNEKSPTEPASQEKLCKFGKTKLANLRQKARKRARREALEAQQTPLEALRNSGTRPQKELTVTELPTELKSGHQKAESREAPPPTAVKAPANKRRKCGGKPGPQRRKQRSPVLQSSRQEQGDAPPSQKQKDGSKALQKREEPRRQETTPAGGLREKPAGGKRRKPAMHMQRGQPLSKAGPVRPPAVTAYPDRGTVGNANWAALKALVGAKERPKDSLKGKILPQAAAAGKRPLPVGTTDGPTSVIALDCEMVGVGPGGARSSLARVCIVNADGNVLMDDFVRQKEDVTDFRTWVSGIRPSNIRNAAAKPFEDVQREAAELLKGRVIVGHSIQSDLKALLLSHPRKSIRDTAYFPPLMRTSGASPRLRPRGLRHLAFELLGLAIQEGEHSPVEDARAALYLYKRHAKAWDRAVETGTVHKLRPNAQSGALQPGSTKSFAALAAKDIMVDL